jgi:Reverse transcriptase (RNA-dependent DNA polymerase)
MQVSSHVRLGFLITALNDLEIMAADVGNAYLNADCREKIWFVAGPEFGTKKGKVLLIRKALYSLKSSGAAWRALFSSTLHELGYVPSKDVYLHPAVKPNGAQYYEMLLVYVDDILHITHNKTLDQNKTMQEIRRIYQLKEGSVGEPSMYLGANVGCVLDGEGNKMWYLSATDYIDGTLKMVTADLPSDTKLKGKAD